MPLLTQRKRFHNWPSYVPSSGEESSYYSSTGGSQADGTLSVTPDPVNLGSQSTGQITLAASGGPVSWSASTSSGRLGLSSDQGTLQAGQSVTVTVNVTRHNGNGGSGYVVVDWNPVSPVAAAEPDASPQTSQDVQVSWSATVTTSPSPSAASPSRPVAVRPVAVCLRLGRYVAV